jgi:enolase
MSAITGVYGREILDSRGFPTVEVEIQLESGAWGRAAVPSGASTGKREAAELRDGDVQRYRGKGVQHAVRNVEETIAPEIDGMEASEQAAIDQALLELDGTPNKSALGANAILAVSLAVARAAADDAGLPLYAYLGGAGAMYMPVPMMNVINGGAHADNGIDFQEFMLVPAGADSFSNALRMGVEVFHVLKEILKSKKLSTGVGDEGGFAPALASNTAALDLLMEAIETAGYRPGDDVALALDIAASEFAEDNGRYRLRRENVVLNADEMVGRYEALVERYHRVDRGRPRRGRLGGLGAADQAPGPPRAAGGRRSLRDEPRHHPAGHPKSIANAVLVKVNQVGTLTETMQAIELSKRAAYGTVISHRSGETEDTFVADLAVAVNAGQIKTGSLARSERTAKHNQLLRIEEEPDAASWPGRSLYAQQPMSPRVLGGTAVVLLAAGVAGYAGNQILRVTQMRREIVTMEREITTLRARTEELTRTVDGLRNDPAYVEKLAREEFGMVRPDETVLKFPSADR